jgi:hypothetical protein
MRATWLGSDVSTVIARHSRGRGVAAAVAAGALAVSGVIGMATPALAVACAITDGTHSYGNLQTALNAAHSGDTLQVSGTCADAPGTNGAAFTVPVSLTLDGASGATVKPKPSGAGRVLWIDAGATVTLNGLTVTGGGGGVALGGGILNLGNLTVSNSTVTGNAAVDGGGIYNYNGLATLTVTGTTVSSNTASANGGGIYNYNGTATLTGSTLDSNTAAIDGGGAYNYTASLTLTGTTVEQNAATENGGGVANDSASLSSGASVTLTGDTFVNDDADNGNGGGIWNDGNAFLTGTAVSLNGADSGSGHGGGIYSAPDWNLIATTSTVSGNTAEFGGGVYNDGSSDNPGFAEISKSTVSGNEAVQGGGGLGNEGDMALINSTVSNNSDETSGGGIFSDTGTRLSLTNVTVSDNKGYQGGGLNNAGALTIAGTIIAGDSGTSTGPDCEQATGGTATDNGYNLIGNTTGCFTTVSTDITNTGAVLGPLASNGGPTETLLPQIGSPAINAIPTSTCESAQFLDSSTPTDQRGTSRPQGGACEIGSVEVAAPVITKFSPTSGPKGTKVTITGTHLQGVTAVYFAGFSSVFTIVSGTKITATVPARAKTGPVMVTAAGGSFTSTKSFKVT